ncbi:MAG: hypothetical protein L0Y56_19250, partial [Nitrospira sp.]|nr:hypothetical protein [Nitrospira sp.]
WPMMERAVSSTSIKCYGCQMHWWLPKEKALALSTISKCAKPHCPYAGKDVSWIGQELPEAKIVAVHDYKKKKHHHQAPDGLVDTEASEEFPKMIYQQMKFKK